MYLPFVFKNSNVAQLHSFMKRYNFCSVISHSSSIRVSHLPLILLPEEGKYGTLVGHMAKANDQWKDFDGSSSILCIFSGPHAYISPSWYKKKPGVPTWNYAVVHAVGIPKLIEDKDQLQKIMDQTISYFEPSLHSQNSDAYIPESYKNMQLDYIIGFKIEIQELVGKFKLGQNRSDEDQKSLVEGLSRQDDHESKQLADFITHYRKSNL